MNNRSPCQSLSSGVSEESLLKNNREVKILVPGVINTKEIFANNFDYHLTLDNNSILNTIPLFAEFEGYLKDVLTEIYSPYVAFDQTDDEEKCKNCPYISICNR